MPQGRRPADDGDATGPARPEGASGRGELVTNTGIRLVGKAIDLVSDTAAAGLRVPDRPDELLFAATFRVRARIGPEPVAPVLAALDAALRPVFGELPPLGRDAPLKRVVGRVNAVQWDCEGDADRWVGELLWRHPHPVISGVPCTTQLVLSTQPGVTSLGIRTGAPGGIPGVRGMVGVAQARPPILANLARAVQLTFEDRPVTPTVLAEGDIEGFVEQVLLSETRTHPVAVLSPTESGEYLLVPEELAESLIGVAPLYLLDRHPTTYRLSDALGGKQLSAYWGALRFYRAGFHCGQFSSDHPLLRHDTIGDAVIRAEIVGKLITQRAASVAMPAGVEALREARSGAGRAKRAGSVPGVPAPGARGGAAADVGSSGAADAGEPAVDVGAVAQSLAELRAAVLHLSDMSTALLNEIVRVRTMSSVRSSSTGALERRLDRLDQLIRRHFEPHAVPELPAEPGDAGAQEASDSEERDQTLVDVVRQAAVSYTDTLVVLDAAERGADKSPYEDVNRVADILAAMAEVSRRRRDGILGSGLRDAFREFGVDYRAGVAASTSRKLRQQYLVLDADGVEYDCAEHIVVGNSYDPRYCLRIYFTSRAPNESRFVIGHVGRHFDVLSTT